MESHLNIQSDDDGRTPSANTSAGAPKKHRARRDRQACKSHYNPVMYALSGREVRAGQRFSMPGLQLSLHEWLPIVKLPQLGPYTAPYCTKAHSQRE